VVIVGSLLLILVAVGLLVAGVLGGSSVLIIASIVTTVIAAVVLILGVRQSASDEDEFDEGESAAKAAGSTAAGSGAGETRAFGQRSSRNVSRASRSGVENSDLAVPMERVAIAVDSHGAVMTTIPTQSRERNDIDADDIDAGAASTGGVGLAGAAAEASANLTQDTDTAPEALDDEDPPGEPPAQSSAEADAERVALLMTDVFVVDGRPRYHVASCVHLLGRESEPLPVSEAVELGFTPCSLCEPNTVLLADSQQA
jgi:hypothetical protein